MIKNNINFFLFLLISICLTIFFVGKNNFFFNEVDWLYGFGDLTNAQLSWKYFLSDEWRFPLGKNPNYGLEISNSIIFTDNIPLFAILFKIFKPFIIGDFQYFGIWVLLCFFLQLLFSFLILNKIIKNNFFSIISSLFFLLVPFLLFRISNHFSLGAHWLILYAFYVNYFIDSTKKNFHWYFLIFLSLLIHLYFTVIIFVIFFCSLFVNKLKKVKFRHVFLDVSLKLFFNFFLMYFVGYFESSPINSVSSGYGIFKIDLLSLFDPKLDGQLISWSIFLKDLPGTNFEGFTYIGIANIILIFLALLIFIFKKIVQNNYTNDFPLISQKNIFLIILLLWALTTNISFLGYEILNINLPKYLFSLLSIFSSTGRFAWPVIYLILIISFIIIYRNTNKTFSSSLIVVLLLIQMADISRGLKAYSFKDVNKFEIKKIDEIWNIIDMDFSKLRTTYLFNNYGPIFSSLSDKLGKLNNIKTDIVLNASLDREKAAQVRYELINKIKNGKLDNDTAYIIDNEGHLIQLVKNFKDKNVGFFYRDGFWIMLPNKKTDMKSEEIQKLNKLNYSKIDLNKKYNIKFKDKILGFGWSHNFNDKGSWSEGENSFLYFKTPISKKNLNLIFDFESYNSNVKEDFELEIYLNNELMKKINLYKNKRLKKVNIKLDNKFSDEDIEINFRFKNLISPYDIFESPDARKLGILLNSILIKEL